MTRAGSPRPAGRAAGVLAVATALVVMDCTKNAPTTPVPDCSGDHLVVLASDRGRAAGQYDLFLYDLDGGGFRLVRNLNSSTAADSSPAISPTGGVIAFVRERTPGDPDVLLYDRCAEAIVVRPALATLSDESDPAFSADNRYLLFVRDTLGHRRIRLFEGAANRLIALPGLDAPGASYDDWDPSPGNHASLIAFVSDRNGNPDVFVYDALGDTLLDLPDLRSADRDLEPSLTPDDHFLCFASDRSDPGGTGFNLLLYDLRARTFIPLANLNGSGDERHPSLSDDGDVIVFQSDRPGSLGKRDIWNHIRSRGATTQSAQESSAADDIQPALLWP